MGIETLAKELIIGFGTELIKMGITKLKDVLTDDEIRDTVEAILPVESASRKAQRTIDIIERLGSQ